MSDSSEEEDLSRFREAVDTSFFKLIDEFRGKTPQRNEKENKPSERYLEESSHYNDVKVSEELQTRIGAKVSAVINKNIEFIDVEHKMKKRKIKGGVKLFKDSEDFLSCEEIQDTSTDIHNKICKKIKKKQRHIENDVQELSEDDKIKATAVSGESILSKEESKFWKSRRKEKIFKYKKCGNGMLIAV